MALKKGERALQVIVPEETMKELKLLALLTDNKVQKMVRMKILQLLDENRPLIDKAMAVLR